MTISKSTTIGAKKLLILLLVIGFVLSFSLFPATAKAEENFYNTIECFYMPESGSITIALTFTDSGGQVEIVGESYPYGLELYASGILSSYTGDGTDSISLTATLDHFYLTVEGTPGEYFRLEIVSEHSLVGFETIGLQLDSSGQIYFAFYSSEGIGGPGLYDIYGNGYLMVFKFPELLLDYYEIQFVSTSYFSLEITLFGTPYENGDIAVFLQQY